MKVLFTGGGTLGSVTPLLAIAEAYEDQDKGTEFVWIGTKTGPEFALIDGFGMDFYAISSGKLRRYISLKNFADLFRIVAGFFQSIVLLRRLRPDVVISAGGFVAVPVIWAAGLLRLRVHIHQQDIRPGLANRLCLPFATSVSVAFERSLEDYAKYEPSWTGNPVRKTMFDGDAQVARHAFGLEEGTPTLLVLGGGTGAVSLNSLVLEAAAGVTEFAQILHVTGKGKGEEGTSSIPRYHAVEFLTGAMKHAYAVADLVVTRAGMGTLTELAALGKPTIIIPMPNSHQEENADFFAAYGKIPVLEEADLDAVGFADRIKATLTDPERLRSMTEGMRALTRPDAAERVIRLVHRSY